MKNVDLDRLLMWKNLHQYLQTQQTVWSTNPAFSAMVYSLGTLINAADAADKEQRKDTTGVTAQREAVANTAIGKVRRVANVAAAYAATTGNALLSHAVRFKPSGIRLESISRRCGALRAVLEAASAHRAALVDYGLRDAHFDEAEAALNALSALTPTSRSAITERAKVTARIRSIVKDGLATVVQLDRLAGLFEDGENDFGRGYRSARVVVSTARRTKKTGE